MLKHLYRAALIALLLAASPVHAVFAEAQGVGVIEDIDLDSGTLIVNGLRFRMAIDAKVTIAGNYGAFTLLEKGMLVRYAYLVISRTEREIVALETRPSNEPYDAT